MTIKQKEYESRVSYLSERRVDVELALFSGGEVVGEHRFFEGRKNSSSYFHILAATDVSALAFDTRAFELHVKRSTSPAVQQTYKRLKRLSRQRNEWRKHRIDATLSHVDACLRINWKIMRKAGLPCCRCGSHAHIATDVAYCPILRSKKQQDGTSEDEL